MGEPLRRLDFLSPVVASDDDGQLREQSRHLGECFKRFHKRLEREYGHVAYIAGREIGPEGRRLHIHAVLAGSQRPFAYAELQRWWAEITGGWWLGKLQAVYDAAGAGRYVTKAVGYVVKDPLGLPLMSRDWIAAGGAERVWVGLKDSPYAERLARWKAFLRGAPVMLDDRVSVAMLDGRRVRWLRSARASAAPGDGGPRRPPAA